MALTLPGVGLAGVNESAGNGAFASPTATFTGEWDVAFTDLKALATEGRGVTVHAERAAILEVWDETVHASDPTSFTPEFRLTPYGAGGNRTRVVENVTFTALSEVHEGLVVVVADAAQARTDDVVFGMLRERLNHGARKGSEEDVVHVGDQGQGFRVVIPEGEFSARLTTPWGAEAGVLYAYNATFHGDVQKRVGYREVNGPTRTPYTTTVNRTLLQVALVNFTVKPLEGDQRPLTASRELSIAGAGRAVFAGASGWAGDGEAVAFERERLVIQGAFEAHGRAAAPGDPPSVWFLRESDTPGDARWAVSGEFAEVRVSGVAVLRDGAAKSVAVGAVALGAAYALYSRISDNHVLKHPVRRAILRAVVREPGRPLKDLASEVGATGGSFRYHVNVLKSRNLLELSRRGKYVVAHPPSSAPTASALLPFMGKAGQIVRHLAVHGPSTAPEIAESLGTSHQLVYHHLKSLDRLGLVEKTGRYPAVFSLAPGIEAGGEDPES